MSSIGEKIKDKLHMGHSSGDDGGHSTMTHDSAKATSVPGTTTTGMHAHTGTGAVAETGRTGAGRATKEFTKVEDRPVEKDVVERVVEHHPVEKKFVTETRPAGEHELTHQRQDESLGTREHVKRAAP
ncbi:hypothetical protein COCOBI_14-3890 [Coccomyxa sp. Obi]|nr:hypothetical protein COCOBI_14-3890 [Coccomyxa sp. Obi]